MTRLLLCTGEPSGDRLAGDLVPHLRAGRSDLELRGITGPCMVAAGVRSIAPLERVSALGLVEAIEAAGRMRGVLRLVDDVLRKWRPDAVVTVGSPSAMLRIAERARRWGCPAIHWVSPQVWAWRAHRVRRVADAVDALLCLFPHEPALYEGLDIDARFTGHPAVVRFRSATSASVDGSPVFLLAPGSRRAEIRRLWPVAAAVAARLRARWPGAGFVVPLAPGVARSDVAGLDGVVCTSTLGAAALAADAALVTSGTATLEVAALGCPMVVMYAVHPGTYAVARRVVRGVRHIALPNILAGRTIVPEHIQDLDPDRIADQLIHLVDGGGAAQTGETSQVIAALEGEGALERTAAVIDEYLP